VTTPNDDLPPLLPPGQSFIIDPVWADTVEAGMEIAALAAPTHGPNRLTMHVPKETTQISLGAPNATRWHTDLGIDGYTNSHIHFETKEEAKTVVSLGGPALTSAITGYGGGEGGGGEGGEGGGGGVCTAQAVAPTGTRGYSMVTDKNAWHDSVGQHYLLSLSGDITLRTTGEGKRAVVQAELGSVDVIGGLEVNMAAKGIAITAHPEMPFQDVLYTKPWTGETPHSVAAHVAETISTVVNGMVTASGLWASGKEMKKLAKSGHMHLSVDTVAAAVEWLADAAELVFTVQEFKELVSKEEAPEGEIKIDADQDLSGAAGLSASFFGLKSANMCAGIWAGINGVGFATVKGVLFAGVVGSYTSCKGYKGVEIGCDHGDAHFAASKNLDISSANADLIVVGKELAQLSSEKDAYFCAAKRTWVGTPAGGWGALLQKDGFAIGKATSSYNMGQATVEASRSIKLDKDGITGKSGSTSMKHHTKGLTVEGGQVKLHAKDADVKVDGKKVLIDA
jgi:hypothetical protein